MFSVDTDYQKTKYSWGLRNLTIPVVAVTDSRAAVKNCVQQKQHSTLTSCRAIYVQSL